jgi:hypothetical protein
MGGDIGWGVLRSGGLVMKSSSSVVVSGSSVGWGKLWFYALGAENICYATNVSWFEIFNCSICCTCCGQSFQVTCSFHLTTTRNQTYNRRPFLRTNNPNTPTPVTNPRYKILPTQTSC